MVVVRKPGGFGPFPARSQRGAGEVADPGGEVIAAHRPGMETAVDPHLGSPLVPALDPAPQPVWMDAITACDMLVCRLPVGDGGRVCPCLVLETTVLGGCAAALVAIGGPLAKRPRRGDVIASAQDLGLVKGMDGPLAFAVGQPALMPLADPAVDPLGTGCSPVLGRVDASLLARLDDPRRGRGQTGGGRLGGGHGRRRPAVTGITFAVEPRTRRRVGRPVPSSTGASAMASIPWPRSGPVELATMTSASAPKGRPSLDVARSRWARLLGRSPWA